MKSRLTKQEKTVVHEAIKKALESGKEWDAPGLHFPVGALISAAEELGLSRHEREGDSCAGGLSTNGWQYDWWQSFKDSAGAVWVLSGPAYYGGTHFEKEEDE